MDKYVKLTDVLEVLLNHSDFSQVLIEILHLPSVDMAEKDRLITDLEVRYNKLHREFVEHLHNDWVKQALKTADAFAQIGKKEED